MKHFKKTIFTLLIAGCVLGNFNARAEQAAMGGLNPGQVKKSLVCMMNNKFMDTEQIPVPVEGKTYYGCCQGCVQGLQNNRALRYTRDPYTGKEVDKAEAFVVLKSPATKEVMYFESKSTFEEYSKAIGAEALSTASNSRG